MAHSNDRPWHWNDDGAIELFFLALQLQWRTQIISFDIEMAMCVWRSR
jgi:hypothetical protein